MIEDDGKKEKKLYKLYLDKYELDVLDRAKKLFVTKARAIRQAIWLLDKKYFEEITKDMKPRHKRIAKKLTKHNLFKHSPEMLNCKMSYRDTHAYIRLINYSYKLLTVHGITAQKPILTNIKDMESYFVGIEIRKKVKEFKLKVKNGFSELYDNFIETRWHNMNFKKEKNMEIDFNDILSAKPRRKRVNEIKKRGIEPLKE